MDKTMFTKIDIIYYKLYVNDVICVSIKVAVNMEDCITFGLCI